MGFISRNLFPACESMCVCCPALRSRSRQPVKRYKKLLAEIFPKSLDGPPNERKIVKLCEYAAKNPLRIPKIAKYLEERCYKELRSNHIKYIRSVTMAYNKLLCMCKGQMAYFAISLLNVVSEMLNKSKQDELLILGCQTLTSFICSQADGTYAHNIEKFVDKVCKQAHEDGDHNRRSCLRASSLQCLSAMVWFMAEFSYIFTAFNKIVLVTLDNYEPNIDIEDGNEGGDSHHNWVNEVVRREGRGGDTTSFSNIIIRPRPEKKDPSLLTREEIETPRVWAQVCIQRMVELAKESTTMRLVLDPMFVYFDTGKDWDPHQGLAMIVLSDMSYLLENSDNHQLVLASVVRHLDHKSVAHDPELKSYIIQVAASLARQIRSSAVLTDMGLVSDLCRHLRKSLQATEESAGDIESNLNISLQNSIEDCLFEISKGIGDIRPLLDMMAISLEKLPSSGVFARATIGSLMILAHVISLALVSSQSQQVFPEALLVQLLKVMLHPNLEVRVGAHQIFSVLLIPSSVRPCRVRAGHLSETKRLATDAAAFASITALLEKLRRVNHGDSVPNNCKGRDTVEDEWKQGWTHKNSPNFYNLGSIIDKTSGTAYLADSEPCIIKLSEDQIAQLFSAFWIQANLPDNQPSNFEAVAHSFVLTLISSQLKNQNDNLVVKSFQLPLSLMNLSTDLNSGILPPVCKRAIFVLSTGMLMFSAKLYQVPEFNNLMKKRISLLDIDPYLGISEDLWVHVKSQSDVGEFGSIKDSQAASSSLVEIQNKVLESDKVILDILSKSLSTTTGLDIDELACQLSEPFTADDAAFVFGQQSILEVNQNQMVSHKKGSLSIDEEITTSSLIEDDTISEASVADLSRFIPKMPSSPSISHVISIGQLLESALEVAGHVVGTSVSTSPLPYDTMTRQCEALGTGTRKKLSNWLAHETHDISTTERFSPPPRAIERPAAPWKVMGNGGPDEELVKPDGQCFAMRLPPASPFDNFLKAAGC